MKLSDIKQFQPISIDTRTLQAGDVFLALNGDNFDGHDFVREAEQKGAIAAIIDREVNCNLSIIKTNDTFYALGELALKRREQVNIPVMAVTGSCGKTTTKTMLASILNTCGKTLATEENLNNNIGVPLTLLLLNSEYKFAVIEMGANQINEIAYSSKLAQPDIAVITNAAPVHLQGFGDLDGVARVKGDILQGLREDGTAIFNADDKYFNFWQSLLGYKRCLSFAIQEKADISAHDIIIDKQRTCFILQTPIGEQSIELPIIGKHNVMNALAASAAAFAAGIPLSAIEEGLQTMQPVAKRMVHKSGRNGSIIIDDSYNANPRSMHAAMQVLLLGSGEKILVVGDMVELSNMTEQYHHELGIEARKLGINQLYAIGQLTHLTVKAFGEKAHHFENRSELIAAVNDILDADVTILVKGSKPNRMWEIVAELLETDKR